jgi:hypothetical protein
VVPMLTEKATKAIRVWIRLIDFLRVLNCRRWWDGVVPVLEHFIFMWLRGHAEKGGRLIFRDAPAQSSCD